MKFVKYNDNKSVTIPADAIASFLKPTMRGSWKWPAPRARSFCQRAR